jgi:hypothetical protein
MSARTEAEEITSKPSGKRATTEAEISRLGTCIVLPFFTWMRSGYTRR